MKITQRVVLGLLGTVVLASLMLFALDAYYAEQSASQLAALAKNADAADEDHLPDESESDSGDVKPSIGTREQPIVYQTREQTNHTQDNRQNTAAIPQAGQADVKEEVLQEQKKQADSEKNLFRTVTEDYFSDALFIGDSRTVGMQQSGLLPNATYYAEIGIGIGDILSKRIVNENGMMISVEDALGRHSFGKVYIMIGINDISRGDVDWFVGQYAKILEAVHETQPEAVIYIQGNIPMSYGTQDMNGSLNNRNLSLRNEASRAFADQNDIFYLDIEEIFADGNGNLASIYTSDGLHVGSGHYPLWVDYLLHHAIVR